MPNLDASSEDSWSPTPLQPSEARLTVVQVTDVYTLEHFASLKTMLKETRQTLAEYKKQAAASAGSDSDDSAESTESATESDKTSTTEPEYLTRCYDDGVISMLTGDFLAPYLLSSIDRGKGMMNAIAATPIDYLTWGNHEAGTYLYDSELNCACRHGVCFIIVVL